MRHTQGMSLWEFLEKEGHTLAEVFHQGELDERTWECDFLLVLDSDWGVAFCGKMNVDVTPNPDGTATLVPQSGPDGGPPSLINARVWSVGPYGSYAIGANDGLRCEGLDEHGDEFEWYINRAAELVSLHADRARLAKQSTATEG
jgi:hypothetical protein